MPRSSCPYRYVLFGQKVESAIPLGNLPHYQAGKADITLKQLAKGPRVKPRWYHVIRNDEGERLSSFGRLADKLVLRFHGTGDLIIDQKRRSISVQPQYRASREDIQAFILSQGLPSALTALDHFVLHASAVEIDGKALAFFGEQDRGKSTLAAAFVKAGYHILSDDGLLVRIKKNQALVVPSYPEVRVAKRLIKKFWGARASEQHLAAFSKLRRSISSSYCSTQRQLTALFLLDEKPPSNKAALIEIDQLKPRDAWAHLLRHSFRFDLEDRKRLKEEVLFLGALAELVPVKSLRIRRGLDALPQVVKQIVQSIERKEE